MKSTEKDSGMMKKLDGQTFNWPSDTQTDDQELDANTDGKFVDGRWSWLR